MNLSKDTWEAMIMGLQDKITYLNQQNTDLSESLDEACGDLLESKKLLIGKCNEVTELKSKLNEYERQFKVDAFIKKMGRRYATPKANLTWLRLLNILYPSADEEYHKKGKAKEAIQNLLRSYDLGFDDDGTIFRQH